MHSAPTTHDLKINVTDFRRGQQQVSQCYSLGFFTNQTFLYIVLLIKRHVNHEPLRFVNLILSDKLMDYISGEKKQNKHLIYSKRELTFLLAMVVKARVTDNTDNGSLFTRFHLTAAM